MEIKRLNNLGLTIVLIVFCVAFFFSAKVEFNGDPEAILPKSISPQIQKDKAQEENWELYYIKSSNTVFDKEYLSYLNTAEKSLMANPAVKEVVSIVNLKIDDLDFVNESLDSITPFKYSDIHPKFISKNKKWSALYVNCEVDCELELPYSNLFSNINSVGSDDGLNEMLKNDFVRILIFVLTSFLIMFISFLRKLKWIVISFGYIIFCLILMLGIIGMLDLQINTITLVVPVIVCIICISDLMYFFTSYSTISADGFQTIKVLFNPILLTSLTTILGFSTLLFSSLNALNQLGYLTIIGVLIAFLTMVYVIPLFFSFKDGEVNSKVKISWSKKLLIPVAILIGVTSVGISSVEIDQYLFKGIRSDRQEVKILNLKNDQFEGVRKFDVTIKYSQNNLMSKVAEIEQIEEEVVDSFGLGSYDSYLVELKRLNRSFDNGDPSFYKLPTEPLSYNKIIKAWPLDSSRFINNRNGEYRVTGMIPDIGSKRFFHLRTHFKEKYPNLNFNSREDYFDLANYKVVEELASGLAWLIVIVFVVVLVVYKSLRLSFIALMVNFLPLIGLLGWMGFFNIYLNLTTASIFAVLFGIAVDDTIHFIASYSKLQSVDETLTLTGRAILKTTIILGVGFGGLLFSSFDAMRDIGWQMIVGLSFALLSDLIILPSFLSYQKKKIHFKE